MDMIRRTARAARRRLTIARFFRFLPATLGIALLVGLVGVMVPKAIALPIDDTTPINNTAWYAIWIGGVSLIALLINLVLTFVGRPSVADAAAEVDLRFQLRERLSSAMMLPSIDRETELGAALVVDANRKAEGIDVSDRFDLGLSKKLLIPCLPLLLTLLFWVIPNREEGESLAKVGQNDVAKVKNSTKPLMEQIKKKRLLAEKEGLNAAVEMYKKLESELAKLQKDTKLDTKETLTKLNDIKEQLAERKKEIGGAEALKKNLANLEKFQDGPAEKLADALKEGDFEKAQESMEKLLEDLKSGKLDADAMKQLEKQLEQLEKALTDAAEAREQAKQALKEQIKQAEGSGDLQKAAQLQRKLEQMQAQDSSAAKMQEMAQALSQAQQAMQNGDMQSAEEALEQIASQLQQMNQSDQQLQDLDQLMQSLSDSKSQMACSQCNGMGCSSCSSGPSGSMMSQIPGQGMGEGQGKGDRPEAETETDFFDSRVRDQMKIGETVYGGKIGGENRKGTTMVDVQNAVLSSLAEEPEPLDDTPLPKNQRDHARDYFNSIRDGKQ